MGYVRIFINTMEIHARCEPSQGAPHWVQQLCYWSINLKQGNSRKYMAVMWSRLNQLWLSLGAHLPVPVHVFVPAAAVLEGPGNGSHSNGFGQCFWPKWKMWSPGDSGEHQLEQKTTPESNSVAPFEATAGWKKIYWNKARAESLSWSQAWNISPTKTGWVGAVHPGEEKALGISHSSFQYLKRLTRRLERDFSKGSVVLGQGPLAVNWRRIV